MNIAKQLIDGVPHEYVYVQPEFYYGPEERYIGKAYSRYNQIKGVSEPQNLAKIYRTENVVFSDVRFFNEISCIRSNGGKILLIVRPVEKLPEGPNLDHISENDLNKYKTNDPNSPWDYVVENNGTLDDLKTKVLKTIGI
jgi:hypothetical protein